MTDPTQRTSATGRVDKPTVERLCREREIDIDVAYEVLWALADDGWWTTKSDALAAVTAERDKARQMLADAPHQYMVCQTYNGAKCTCWKAGL